MKEAKRCGGVVAAILSTLRKSKRGDIIKITASDEQVKELKEAIDLFTRYGLIEVKDQVSEKELSIIKVK